MIDTGERQVAPTRDGVRRDHVARYEWAATRLPSGARVVDLACGIGYGTQILAEGAEEAVGMDIDNEALAYAREHYSHKRARFWSSKAHRVQDIGPFDIAVCFETIEHIEDPSILLRNLHSVAPVLLASVPNETVFPWRGHKFHHRHYTPAEFEQLLADCGWQVTEWFGQQGAESEVEAALKTGRTVIAVARRSKGISMIEPIVDEPVEAPKVPNHVALLGLGPSLGMYLEITKRLGGRQKFADETWAINALGNVFACDRIWHMDDVRVQEIRSEAAPESNIAAMLQWLKRHPGPVMTSRGHPDYPGLVEFPLQDVVRRFNRAYFNSTAAYAVAYAIFIGVKKISLFGFDFTYENAHHAEKGRACVEFWLGIAAAEGIEVVIPKNSSLMDACNTQAERLYGYDTLDVTIAAQADGQTRVSMTEREVLPTAEEIERLYDHGRHPNPLVEDAEVNT